MWARLGKAASVFERLRQIWNSETLNTTTELHLYKSTVIPAAIYAANTWKGTKRISHMLDVFLRRCLRIILGISWRDHINNDELIKRAGMEDLSNIVRVRRLTLAGHILRLPSDRPSSVAMQLGPDGGRRKRGRPRKTWRHTFQEGLQQVQVSWSSVCGVASDWSRWKSLVAQCCSRSVRVLNLSL